MRDKHLFQVISVLEGGGYSASQPNCYPCNSCEYFKCNTLLLKDGFLSEIISEGCMQEWKSRNDAKW